MMNPDNAASPNTAPAADAPKPPRDDIGCFGCLGLFVIVLLGVPCLGGLAMVGPELWNSLRHKGQAAGPAAVERAAIFIGEIDGGRWKGFAIDARAEWAKPGFNSDGFDRVWFDLPADERVRFERAVAAVAGPPVSDRSTDGGAVEYPPVGSHGVSVSVDRRGGRVSFDVPPGTGHER